MTLVIEDGTGKSDAESYLTTGELVSLLALYGKNEDLQSESDEELESGLRAVHLIQEAKWRSLLQGHKSTRDQRLLWPRAGVVAHHYTIYSDEIPEDLKISMAWAFWEYDRDGGALNALAATGGEISEVEVEGAVRVKFADGNTLKLEGSGRAGEASLLCDELMEQFAIGSLASGFSMPEVGRL